MAHQWKHAVMAGVVMVVLCISGCSLTPQPFEYHHDRDEKSGPGLFSGDKGGFVILGENSKLKNQKKKVPTGSDSSIDPIE